MENPNHKNENTEKKYLKILRMKQFLKVKNGLLELEKYFVELKDIELKDRELKIKGEIESYFLNRLFYLQMIWIGLKKRD